MDLNQGQFLFKRFTNDHGHIIGGAVGAEHGKNDAQLAELLIIGNRGFDNAGDIAGIDEMIEQGLLRLVAQMRQRNAPVIVAEIQVDIVAAGPMRFISLRNNRCNGEAETQPDNP